MDSAWICLEKGVLHGIFGKPPMQGGIISSYRIITS
jgi:hypothetical protein